MSAGLPTEDASSKSVQDWGIGTYDSPLTGDRGEDDEESAPKALPDDGGPLDPFGPDRLLSYPEDASSQGKHASGQSAMDRRRGFGALPGDSDRPLQSRRPEDDTMVDVLPTASSGLPSDSDNPSARADYYDRMQTGQIETRVPDDVWADEDSGAYAVESDGNSSLPGVSKNEFTMDDFLGALGNSWSGYETEDVSGPQGFPSTDFSENVDFDRSDLRDGGRLMAFQSSGMDSDMEGHSYRRATNLELVGELASGFLKKNGKKDLTRRHVMAFLQESGHPQYLASDVIRCLKHRHKVVVADVLDQFPVTREASSGFRSEVSAIREEMIRMEIENVGRPEVSSIFRRNAADLAHVLADLEKSEGRNG